MIEQTLDEMEELLRDHGPDKLTLKIKRSYSEDERVRLLTIISKMRDANARMFRELNLEPSLYTEDRVISARITHMWTILVDSKARGMKGFGELSSEQATTIDAQVDALLTLLDELQ